MSDVTSLPTRINLDLDAEERNPDDVKEPFVVNVGGRTVTFIDPEDVDWQDLYDVDGPYAMLRIGTSSEDRRHILDQKLPTWKFTKLIQAYNQHFGVDEKVAEARRRALREV